MSSFKKKLKILLYDSSLKIPKNIEQKLDNIMLKTYRKIKRDNTRKSILNYKNNSSKNIKSKNKIENIYFSIKKNYSFSNNNKRGISPKTAISMLETLSIINKKNSRNVNNDSLYLTMHKYLNSSMKIKNKIQKNIDYIKNDNSNSKNKYSICNRPKCSFNNKFNESKKASIYNMKQIYNKKLIENKKIDDHLFKDMNNNDKDLRKNNLYFYESFNRHQKNKKNQSFNYSRKICEKNFYKDSFIFNYC